MSELSNLKTIAQRVEFILRKYPGTRDDDRELFQTYFAYFHQIDFYTPFGAVMRNHKLPSFESIRRSRQKIQAEDEGLRGSKASEDARMQKQADYIAFAREDIRS